MGYLPESNLGLLVARLMRCAGLGVRLPGALTASPLKRSL